MGVDVTNLPVVDVHSHPFLNAGEVTAQEFTTLASFGGVDETYMTAGGIEVSDAVRAELQRVKRDTLYHRRLVRDLAGFFGCDADLASVVTARNAAVAADYRAYVARLYADAGLVGAVMDFGYPLPSYDVAEVQRELPIEVVPIYRIEPLIVELLREELAWSEFRQRFDDTIGDALTNQGYRGVKSIIAYRTGLDVSPLARSADQGYLALDAIRRGLGGGAMKKLRDHLLCRALELCIEHDVPMQIHTGMGDHEVNLALAHPALLLDLLRYPVYRACEVILVHTGYPFHGEAGYIAGVLPRVYCDIGEGVPFASHGGSRILAEVLEMAPFSKVMYSSDGYKLPEILYTSAKVGKQIVSETLDTIVARGWLDAGTAQEAAGLILAGTARRLYRMDG